MDCGSTPALVHPFIDSELDPGPAAELAAHLRDCPSCTHQVEEQRVLQRTIRRGAQRYRAPDRLRSAITAALAAEAEAESRPETAAPATATVVPLPHPMPAPSRWATWRPLAFAASIALAVVTSSGITAYIDRQGAQDQLAQDVVASHVRSLMANHLTDVQSSDQHTVKPWFHGRIDLSPAVEDLAADGFPLVGGRMDYIENRPVAALVYRHRQHPINLFVLPASSATGMGSESFSEHGYNVLHWRHGDMSLWAASDLNLAELKEFQRLYEQRTAASPAS